jgi:hypothetical protein
MCVPIRGLSNRNSLNRACTNFIFASPNKRKSYLLNNGHVLLLILDCFVCATLHCSLCNFVSVSLIVREAEPMRAALGPLPDRRGRTSMKAVSNV